MRLYILGLNNPQSSDPAMALYPHDETSTGHRLWSMVNEVMPIDVEEWLRTTQRVNLLSDMVLPRDYRGAIRRRGPYLHTMVSDRICLFLGSDVANAMQHTAEPFVAGGPHKKWFLIPHPSGKNLFYNNPVNRLAAGLLVSELWENCPSPGRA